MAKKRKGYVELYWSCPNCGNENLGSDRFCTSCGSPQPQNVDFHQASKQQLLTDAQKLKQAKAGADVHCGFCGTRNPATAAKCSQCGSELHHGTRRSSAGRVVGAFTAGAPETIKCSNCGTLNPGERLKCQNCGASLKHGEPRKQPKIAGAAPVANRNLLIIGGLLALLACAAFYFLFVRTREVRAQVISASWQRSVVIEVFAPVQLEGWRAEIPAEATILSCSEEVSYTQDEPPTTDNYTEVCGTEYTVETGSGFAEVVQDCVYQVYEDYCSYETTIWAPVATAQLEGFDLSPVSPDPALATNQRLAEESSHYVCVFANEDKTYEYVTNSIQEFQQCVVGSEWALTINGAGAVTAIDPAN